ncbi:hypothetical protein IMCC1923_33310 [Rhodobacteraceae bacterium IMCC1923]|nr:hypothetical protein [Rhodobacteraceae bacterium IMCC1923]
MTYAIVETGTGVFEAIEGVWDTGTTTFTPGDGSSDVAGITDVAPIYADTNTLELGMYTPTPPNVVTMGADVAGLTTGVTYAIVETGTGVFEAIEGVWDTGTTTFTPGDGSSDVAGITDVAPIYADTNTLELGMYTPTPPNVVTMGADVAGLTTGVTYAIVETGTGVFEAIEGVWDTGTTTFTPGDGSSDVAGITDVAPIYADTNTLELGMYTPSANPDMSSVTSLVNSFLVSDNRLKVEFVDLSSEIDTEAEFVSAASIGEAAQSLRIFYTKDGNTNEQMLDFGNLDSKDDGNVTFLAPNEDYSQVTTTSTSNASMIVQLDIGVDVTASYDVVLDPLGDGFHPASGLDNDLSYTFTA